MKTNLGIIPTKEMKDLYNKNFIVLEKAVKDYKRWNGLPCSWISRINIVKVKFYKNNLQIQRDSPSKLQLSSFQELKEKS